MRTISFDLDKTLMSQDGSVLPVTASIARQHIDDGDRVVVVTGRNPDADATKWVKDNVDQSVKTLFTSGELKWKTLESIGSELHYDDTPMEIDSIKKNTKIDTVYVTEGKKYGDKTACVYDYGTFTSVAHRLCLDFGRVLYFNPWKSGFPLVNDTLVGTGYAGMERIDNFWDHLECDLYIFPEVADGDIQEHLVSLGKNVWGSRKAEILEMSRFGWIQFLQGLGLNVPDTREVTGIDSLQEILENENDIYVKIDDRYRGNFETFRSKTWNTTKPIIDKLRLDMGPAANKIKFIAQKAISGRLEFGFDTWCVDGEFPDTLLCAYEIKDAGYIGEVNEFTNMPQGVIDILDKIKGALKSFGYRGNFSAEFREDEEGKWYFGDPCLRFPNPGSFAMMCMCDNFSDIVYEGSQGTIIQPVWNTKYGSELTIRSEFLLEHFGELFCPEETRMNINRMNACIIDDGEWTVPKGKTEWFGSVCLTDDDPDKLIERMKEIYDTIEGYQLMPIDHGMLDAAVEELKKEY